jgi:retron-type reverse transcriptase
VSFDELPHSAILDRVRRRAGDKRILALIKAFLKAGIMTEEGQQVTGTITGTPQGGLCSAEHNPPYAQCWVMRSAGR